MCKELREQDEILCSECGRRWDVSEQRPACSDDQSKARGDYNTKLAAYDNPKSGERDYFRDGERTMYIGSHETFNQNWKDGQVLGDASALPPGMSVGRELGNHSSSTR